MTIRITTLLTAGVVIGVTLGAMLVSVLPVWLGILTIITVGCVATMA